MGKIINVSNCTGNRSGSTVVAIASAIGLSYLGLKKVLLINCSSDKKLEQYLDNIDFKYSLDYIFAMGIENMKDLYVPINNDLNAIGNFKLKNIDNKETYKQAVINYLNHIKQFYDYIVVDSSNCICTELLQLSDINLNVCIADKYLLKDLKNCDFYKDLDSQKSIFVINKVNSVLQKDKEYTELLNVEFDDYNFVTEDIDIYYHTSIDKSLYEYLIDNIKTSNNDFIDDILDICFKIMNPLENTVKKKKTSFFTKVKRIKNAVKHDEGVVYEK